jgi:hypothetical protein
MIRIKKNAVSPTLFAELEGRLETIPWFFVENTAYYYGNQNDIFDYSWQHIPFIDGRSNSYLAEFTESIILSALDNSNISFTKLLKVRYGMITALETQRIHQPHVDLLEPHTVGLIYLNDSDGDTILYNEKYDVDSALSSSDYYSQILNNTVTIKETFSPEKNKMLVFDGRMYHSSSTPSKHSSRIVLNFSFTQR